MSYIDPDHIDAFETYLEGALTEQERAQFEQRLLEDESFASSFRAYQTLNKELPGAIEDRLRQQLKDTDGGMAEVGHTGLRGTGMKRIYWAAGIAAIVMGFIIGVYQLRSEKRIFNRYWEPEIGLPVTMSEARSWNPAMNAFKQEQWDQAENLLMEFTSDTASYFLGMVTFERGQATRAMEWFDSVPSNSIWYPKAQYRKALLLLRQNKREEAIEVLESIPESTSRSTLPIKALLEELKKQPARLTSSLQLLLTIAIADKSTWLQSCYSIWITAFLSLNR